MARDEARLANTGAMYDRFVQTGRAVDHAHQHRVGAPWTIVEGVPIHRFRSLLRVGDRSWSRRDATGIIAGNERQLAARRRAQGYRGTGRRGPGLPNSGSRRRPPTTEPSVGDRSWPRLDMHEASSRRRSTGREKLMRQQARLNHLLQRTARERQGYFHRPGVRGLGRRRQGWGDTAHGTPALDARDFQVISIARSPPRRSTAVSLPVALLAPPADGPVASRSSTAAGTAGCWSNAWRDSQPRREWRRAYAEINDFEQQPGRATGSCPGRSSGSTSRLRTFRRNASKARRVETPHKRWKITARGLAQPRKAGVNMMLAVNDDDREEPVHAHRTVGAWSRATTSATPEIKVLDGGMRHVSRRRSRARNGPRRRRLRKRSARGS